MTERVHGVLKRYEMEAAAAGDLADALEDLLPLAKIQAGQLAVASDRAGNSSLGDNYIKRIEAG